jgi:hypothetical protein
MTMRNMHICIAVFMADGHFAATRPHTQALGRAGEGNELAWKKTKNR